MNRLVRVLTRGGALLLALYAAACLYLWREQQSLVFEPTPVLQTRPARMGMAYEVETIPVDGPNEYLKAWWVPAVEADAPTVLYLHGNARNISHNLEHTLRLHRLGYNVLLPDYRGFGESSPRQPDEQSVYADAEAAWRHLLEKHAPARGKAFIYGHSLGGAIAIELATHHPEAAGLIVESTFTSMRDMGKLEYGFMPIDLLLNQRFESLAKVGQLKIPFLVVHGTWDARIPSEMGVRLHDAAPAPKRLLLIEGGEHSNSGSIGLTEYRAVLDSFVRRHDH